MTIEANKRVMKQFLVFINTASEALATELISPDAIFHVPGRPEPLQGPSGYLALIGMMRGGFPDIQWTRQDRCTLHDAGNAPGDFPWRSADRQED